MRDDICSIPISEVFERGDGCPICGIRNMLEERMLEYIMGAAMMEPDVRIKTNKLGFCAEHFCMMLARRNRLSVALMLDSHLEEISKEIFSSPYGFLLGSSGKSGRAGKMEKSCFVCAEIDSSMEKLLGNMFALYEKERDFRRLFEEQTALCLPHYVLITVGAKQKLSSRYCSEFTKTAEAIAARTLNELHGQVKHFAKMFDYRNNSKDADWGDSRDSIERSVWWLTTRLPK